MHNDEVIEFCIANGVNIRQYFIMYLLSRKDFERKDSYLRRYIHTVEDFPLQDVKDLEEKGFIEDFNNPGETYPAAFMLTPKANEVFVTDDIAQELWDKYPTTFPLSSGGNFMARVGDRDELMGLYLKKIKNSRKQHDRVMLLLDCYIELVDQGKINGTKLSNFITHHIWEVVEDIKQKEDENGEFGRII